MNISIIIPTLDCARDIKVLLDSIVDLGLNDICEIIVVDAFSQDGTPLVIERYDFAKLIKVGRVSKGQARNMGIEESSGDVIVNIDSDVKLLRGWYEALEESMGYSDIVAGYSPDPDGKHLPRVPIYVEGQDISYPCCNIAHKRKVFEDIGLYGIEQNLPEDIEFNYRCVQRGYVINYNPRMKLYHYQRLSKVGFVSQSFWNGEARYELNRLHPEFKGSHQHGVSLKNVIRLGFGALGFTLGRFMRSKGEKIGK